MVPTEEMKKEFIRRMGDIRTKSFSEWQDWGTVMDETWKGVLDDFKELEELSTVEPGTSI